jgi:DNA-binding protein Fis
MVFKSPFSRKKDSAGQQKESTSSVANPSGELQSLADSSSQVISLQSLSSLANPREAEKSVVSGANESNLDRVEKDVEDMQYTINPLFASEELEGTGKGDRFTPEGIKATAGVKTGASIGETAGKGYKTLIGGNEVAHTVVGASLGSLHSTVSFFEKARDAWKKKDWASGFKLFAEAGDTTHKVFTQLDKIGVSNLSAGAASMMPGIGAGISAFKSAVNIGITGVKLENLSEYNHVLNLQQSEKDILNKYIARVEGSIVSELVDFYLSLAELILSFSFPPAAIAVKGLKTIKGLFLTSLESWREFKGSKERQALLRVTGAKDSMSEDELGELSGLRDKMTHAETGRFNLKNGSLRDLLNIKLEIDTVDRQIQSISGENSLKVKLNTQKSGLTDSLNNGIRDYNETLSASEETRKYQISIEDVGRIVQIHSNVMNEVLKKANTEKSLIGKVKNIFHKEEKDKILKEIFNGKLPTDIPIEDLSKGEHADYFWDKTEAALNSTLKGRTFFSSEELKGRLRIILSEHGVDKKEVESVLS